jgi:hypothetical protein
MKFDWDEAKNEKNIRERGLDFTDACEMFDAPMLVLPDTRKDYGEIRHIGFGYTHGRLMVVVYAEQKPATIRIISFRKANNREQANFEKTIQDRLGQG